MHIVFSVVTHRPVSIYELVVLQNHFKLVKKLLTSSQVVENYKINTLQKVQTTNIYEHTIPQREKGERRETERGEDKRNRITASSEVFCGFFECRSQVFESVGDVWSIVNKEFGIVLNLHA